MPAVNDVLRTVYQKPGGKWLIAKMIGRAAPYSGSIGAEVLELGAGYSRLKMPDTKKVRNHLDSIHACAMATLTETSVGLSVLYTLPKTARGIATNMHLEYHAKARGPITAECRWPVPALDEATEQDIEVSLTDESGTKVATGSVRFRFSPVRR